jgi:hypothetical protein
VSHATRYALTVVLFFILVLAAVIAVILFFKGQIDQNNAQWCDTLRLLTSHPVTKPSNPAANPSRVASYQLYLDFLTLKHRFGC